MRQRDTGASRGGVALLAGRASIPQRRTRLPQRLLEQGDDLLGCDLWAVVLDLNGPLLELERAARALGPAGPRGTPLGLSGDRVARQSLVDRPLGQLNLVLGQCHPGDLVSGCR